MTRLNKNNNTTKKYEANNRISLRLSEHDNEYLHEKAQGHNISRSKFIRHLIHNNEHDSNHEISFSKAQLKNIKHQLTGIKTVLSKIYLNVYRIGGNLNQIAREMKDNVPNKLINETKSNANRYKEDENDLKDISNNLSRAVHISLEIYKTKFKIYKQNKGGAKDNDNQNDRS